MPTSTSTDACASATTTTLTAALKENKQISGAIVVGSKGLQDVKCSASWSIASFANNIDGGSVLFNYDNGAWVAKDAGTDVCNDDGIPAAVVKAICS